MAVSYTADTPAASVKPTHLAVQAPGYRRDVDGLRAVAVLSVIAFHAFPQYLHGGYVGVDVFFVISGFLISRIILQELAEEKFSFLNFYIRRIKRIFPALITMLLVVLGVGWLVLLPDEYQLLGRNVVAGAAFLTNLSLYEDYQRYFGHGENPLIHLWSLGIEEQFYLIWPLFLWAVWNLTTRRFQCILLITAMSFGLNITALYTDPTGCFYLPWNRLWELSSGAALAHVQTFSTAPFPHLQSWVSRTLPSWLFNAQVPSVLAITLLLASLLGLNGELTFPGWWALLPNAGTLLLLSVGPGGWFNLKLLSRPSVVFIGLISYPLYLWHWPLLAIANIATRWNPSNWLTGVMIAIAFLLSWVTYKYIESPIRRSPARPPVAVRLGASMTVCAALGVLALSAVITPWSDSPTVERYIRPASEDWLPDHRAVAGARWVRWAHWTVSVDGLLTVGRAPRHVLFIGDSNMQQYYPRILKILGDHPGNSHNAVFAIGAGCAPVLMEILQLHESEVYLESCRKTIRRGVEYARNPDVDVIVISVQWYRYLIESTDNGNLPTDGLLRALQDLVFDFIKDGKRVFLILNIPMGSELDPRQMIQRTMFPLDFPIRIRPMQRSTIDELVQKPDSAIRQIARATGATVIDPLEFLCTATMCPAVTREGEPMYRDGWHLRPSYVKEHVFFLDRTILDPGIKHP